MITLGVVLVTLAALATGAALMAAVAELVEQRQQTATLKRLAEAFTGGCRLLPPSLPSNGRSRS